MAPMAIVFADLPAAEKEKMLTFLAQHQVKFAFDGKAQNFTAHVQILAPGANVDDADDKGGEVGAGVASPAGRATSPRVPERVRVLEARLRAAYQGFCGALPPLEKAPKEMLTPELRKYIELVYADRYAIESQRLRLDAIRLQSGGVAPPRHRGSLASDVLAPLPRTAAALARKHGISWVLEQKCWTVAASLERIRDAAGTGEDQHYEEFELFARFLGEVYDNVALLFFLILRDEMRSFLAGKPGATLHRWKPLGTGHPNLVLEAHGTSPPFLMDPLVEHHRAQPGNRSKCLPRLPQEERVMVDANSAIAIVRAAVTDKLQGRMLDDLDAAMQEQGGQELTCPKFLLTILETYHAARNENFGLPPAPNSPIYRDDHCYDGENEAVQARPRLRTDPDEDTIQLVDVDGNALGHAGMHFISAWHSPSGGEYPEGDVEDDFDADDAGGADGDVRVSTGRAGHPYVGGGGGIRGDPSSASRASPDGGAPLAPAGGLRRGASLGAQVASASRTSDGAAPTSQAEAGSGSGQRDLRRGASRMTQASSPMSPKSCAPAEALGGNGGGTLRRGPSRVTHSSSGNLGDGAARGTQAEAKGGGGGRALERAASRMAQPSLELPVQEEADETPAERTVSAKSPGSSPRRRVPADDADAALLPTDSVKFAGGGLRRASADDAEVAAAEAPSTKSEGRRQKSVAAGRRGEANDADATVVRTDSATSGGGSRREKTGNADAAMVREASMKAAMSALSARREYDEAATGDFAEDDSVDDDRGADVAAVASARKDSAGEYLRRADSHRSMPSDEGDREAMSAEDRGGGSRGDDGDDRGGTSNDGRGVGSADEIDAVDDGADRFGSGGASHEWTDLADTLLVAGGAVADADNDDDDEARGNDDEAPPEEEGEEGQVTPTSARGSQLRGRAITEPGQEVAKDDTSEEASKSRASTFHQARPPVDAGEPEDGEEAPVGPRQSATSNRSYRGSSPRAAQDTMTRRRSSRAGGAGAMARSMSERRVVSPRPSKKRSRSLSTPRSLRGRSTDDLDVEALTRSVIEAAADLGITRSGDIFAYGGESPSAAAATQDADDVFPADSTF